MPESYLVRAERSELHDSWGLARALDWVLRGRIVTPEEARELGLVHEVVDDAPARALELAEEIALLPPMSVANAKRTLYQGADTDLQAAASPTRAVPSAR